MPCPLGCPGADVHSGQQLGHSQEASSHRLSVSRVPAVDTGTQASSGLQGAPRSVLPARCFRCECWSVGQVRPTPIPVVLIKTRSESRPESCRRTSRPLACRECITDDWVDRCAARRLSQSHVCRDAGPSTRPWRVLQDGLGLVGPLGREPVARGNKLRRTRCLICDASQVSLPVLSWTIGIVLRCCPAMKKAGSSAGSI